MLNCTTVCYTRLCCFLFCFSSTFLTLLLFPLKNNVLVVFPSPGDCGLWGPFGLAGQGRVVILADAHGRRRAVDVDDVGRNWKEHLGFTVMTSHIQSQIFYLAKNIHIVTIISEKLKFQFNMLTYFEIS